MDELERLRARQSEIADLLRALNTDIAQAEPTEDQQRRWDELDAEHRDLTDTGIPAAVEAAEREQRARREREDRAARVAESRSRWGSTQFGAKVEPFDGADVRSLGRGEARDRARKVLESREHADHLDDEQKTRLDRLVRTESSNLSGSDLAKLLLASEHEHYRTAFRQVLSGGTPILSAEEGRAIRQFNELRTAMSLTDAAGGYGVPVLIDPTIVITAQGHPNEFFQISRVEQITNDEWKGVSSAGATWYWTTEGVTSTDGSPTLAQPTVPTKKLTGWIPYSVEIGGDYPSFAAEMSRVLNSGYNEKLVEALTNGLGTTAQPTGIITAIEATAGSQVAVTTDGEFHPGDVYALWAALPIRYRFNARWMSATSVQNKVRQFGEDDDANFSVNLTAGEIPSLFGKPYHANDYMDSMVASTSDATLLIVGDFQNLLIAQRVGMTVEVVQHVLDTTSGAPTGQRGLWAWARIGSDSINDAAFRILSQT